jgi:toxoflavin synthase
MSVDHHAIEALYEGAAETWARNEPSWLSDFTTRPVVLEMCSPCAGARVLVLGCGEGYCARQLRSAGAREVLGIDTSTDMIAAAIGEELRQPLGIHYRQGDATDLEDLESEAYDLVVAVFLFNYLTRDAMRICMRDVRRLLRTGGRFVFSVAHPAYPFMRAPGPPCYFDLTSKTYYGACDQRFAGKVWKRDGATQDVEVVHKTLEDYFIALRRAGFESLPELRELGVTTEMAEVDPAFFGPLLGFPLHLALGVVR